MGYGTFGISGLLAALKDAFNHAIRSLTPRLSSGLVEMQRYLSKLGR